MAMWVKFTSERAMHRKLRAAGFAARGLDEAAICQVAADLTDGHISAATVEALAVAHGEKKWRRLADQLVEVGRWVPNGDGWHIHGYLDFNPSRAEWEIERMTRVAAGRRGGQASASARAAPPGQASASARGQANRQASAQPSAVANAQASAQANAQPDFKDLKPKSKTLKPPNPQGLLTTGRTKALGGEDSHG